MNEVAKKNAYVLMHYDEITKYRNTLEDINSYFKDTFGGSFDLGDSLSVFTAIKNDCIEHDFLPAKKYFEYCRKLNILNEKAEGATSLIKAIESDFGGFSLINVTHHGFSMLMAATYDGHRWLEDALYESLLGPNLEAIEETWEELSSNFNAK